MTDSVSVFPPGYRLTDSATGAPLSGAVIRFYDAGTTTPKTVYADADLATSLGTSVTTDALGYPTSDGSTKTLVYVGTSAYKVTIETSAAVVIATHDTVKGAVPTSDPGNVSVTSTRPLSTKSLNYTVVSGDQNTVFAGNCSGGDVTFTLPSAVTAGNGWAVTVQHAGAANECFLATVFSQTISEGATSYGTQMCLVRNGHEVTLVSDGGNWRVANHSFAQFKAGVGVITVTDRLSAPSSPEAGDINIVTSAPSGGFSTFAEHDLAVYNGAAWYKITPPTDCGWLAYVKDEDETYQFIGSAWVQLITNAASQADMETGTSLLKAVTPGRVQNHPGVAKFWAGVSNSGSPSVAASLNVSSLTDSGAGLTTININTDFSSGNYACVASADTSGSSLAWTACIESKGAGSVRVRTRRADNGNSDDISFNVVGFGDQ